MATSTGMLEQELEFFELQRVDLLARAPGKYALVKGAELIGLFDTELEAVRAGYRHLGNVPFLVKHVVEADVPLVFTTFNLGVWLPVYTSTVPDLAASGPSIHIAVGPSRELIAAFSPLGVELSPPHPAAAIIDTGAHTTVLSPEIIARLRIQPVGKAPICTPSTTSALMCDRYHVNIYFAEDFIVENVFAIEAPMGGVPYHCLIGRDILRLANFVYKGRENSFELTFWNANLRVHPRWVL